VGFLLGWVSVCLVILQWFVVGYTCSCLPLLQSRVPNTVIISLIRCKLPETVCLLQLSLYPKPTNTLNGTYIHSQTKDQQHPTHEPTLEDNTTNRLKTTQVKHPTRSNLNHFPLDAPGSYIRGGTLPEPSISIFGHIRGFAGALDGFLVTFTLFHRFVVMKTVAVVCSAPYMVGSGMGSEIDGCDLVVRVNGNLGLVGDYGDDIGRRTDFIYAMNGMFSNPDNYPYARGFRMVKKSAVFRQNLYSYGGHRLISNTGVLACCHYAALGYRVRAFGMSFYADSVGVVPDVITMSDSSSHVVVDRSEIYIPGYQREFASQDSFALRHIGGLYDLALVQALVDQYGLECDPVMSGIVRGNWDRARRYNPGVLVLLPGFSHVVSGMSTVISVLRPGVDSDIVFRTLENWVQVFDNVVVWVCPGVEVPEFEGVDFRVGDPRPSDLVNSEFRGTVGILGMGCLVGSRGLDYIRGGASGDRGLALEGWDRTGRRKVVTLTGLHGSFPVSYPDRWGVFWRGTGVRCPDLSWGKREEVSIHDALCYIGVRRFHSPRRSPGLFSRVS
jgi:hypothetical protein